MKKIIALFICTVLFSTFCVSTFAVDISGDAKSMILIEQNTGKVLYEANADAAYPPASVTKIMTALLVVEALNRGQFSLNDMVSVSENAASMGGSQIYLEVGEQMSVDDMLKSVMVASANDAAAALAEFTAGSLSGFVDKMNERAKELGMNNTHFENTNGLDDTAENHLTSARDIALMSAELLKHPVIFNYTTIWMDTVRDGKFTLTNTNRLIKFFDGANGLKTGSTSKAGFCISATAKRSDMQLIAVVMGASTRDIRNKAASELLEYGFANYSYSHFGADCVNDIEILGGIDETVSGEYTDYSAVTEKGKKIERNIMINEKIEAPVTKGDKIGTVTYTCDGETVYEDDVLASSDVARLNFIDNLKIIIKKCLII